MSEYKTLLERKAELDAQIAEVRAQEKADAITKVRELIHAHGISSEDILSPGKKPKGSVGVAKFRDPASGATWTGRGKPPNWINGKDRAPFLIVQAA
ncbi:H-NS histone family protein [Delftia acidovorans]|uniref:H-NS histone family protein n=1 Tax=Delftia acidovorans TaxID=80866 RepID=UPI002FDD8ECC